jgi:hypothetical protein
MIGLKRIGIILSVLWVVVGGVWTRTVIGDFLTAGARSQLDWCLKYSSKDKDCDAEFYDNFQRDVTEGGIGGINIQNAIFTFGPLLLAWVLFYIIARLTRWVAAGFRQDAERKLSDRTLT